MLDLVAAYSADPLDPAWLLSKLGLTDARKTPYRRLSGGQQQRLSLACALVGRPELYFWTNPPPASTLRHVYSCGNSSTLCDATA